jgi:hypothetical protein
MCSWYLYTGLNVAIFATVEIFYHIEIFLGKAEQENKDLILQQGILTAIYYLSKGACKETRNKD